MVEIFWSYINASSNCQKSPHVAFKMKYLVLNDEILLMPQPFMFQSNL